MKKILIKSSLVIAAAGLLRAVLAYVVQAAIAYKFGATLFTDAYFVAIFLPLILGDYLVSGILTLAIIPIFLETKAKKGIEKAWQIVSTLINHLCWFLSLISVLVYIFSPSITAFLAPGLSSEGQRLVAEFLRILSPTIVFFGFSVFFTAIAHANQRYTAAAIAPLFFSLGIIVFAFFLSGRFGFYSILLGSLLGAGMQMLVQGWDILKIKPQYSFRFSIFEEEIFKIAKLSFPLFLTVLVAQGVNLLQKYFASFLEAGSISYLNYAQYIMQVPVILISLPISIIIFPLFSDYAAHRQMDEFRRIFSRVFRLFFFLTLPITLGTMVLRVPIVSILFEHGSFDASSVLKTSFALFCFMFGFFAFAINRILARVFYSLQKAYVPLISLGLGLVSFALLSLILMQRFAYAGIALAFSLYNLVLFGVFVWALNCQIKSLITAEQVRAILKIAAGSAAMGAAMWYLDQFYILYFGQSMLTGRIIELLVISLFGFVIYLGICWALRVEEINEVRMMFRELLNKEKGQIYE